MNGMGLMPEIAPEPDTAAMVEAVFRAIAERNELAPWMGASVAVVLLVHLARAYGRRLPLVGRWLDHPVVAFALPLLASLAGGLLNALIIPGAALGAAMLGALKVAALATWGYVGMKKVQEAKAAGKAAAESVQDADDAARVLRIKGPL